MRGRSLPFTSAIADIVGWVEAQNPTIIGLCEANKALRRTSSGVD
ncbi:hypothetical protein [Nostoc sp.]